jgi:peptidoglycan hydrolase-like protein with peptidoglycan-binding domain
MAMRRSAILAGSFGLAALFALPAAAQPVPPTLAYVQPLPVPAVQSVQAKLQQAGVYAGQVDGVWGADSAAALTRFQQLHQLQVTGQLNQATVATLGLDPNTMFVASAAAPVPVAVPPPLDHLAPTSVRALQARLGTLGFYSGAVDGVWGDATEGAIVRFQRARGLQPDGQLGPATVTAMGLAADALAYR